jgi:hypothetical protein
LGKRKSALNKDNRRRPRAATKLFLGRARLQRSDARMKQQLSAAYGKDDITAVPAQRKLWRLVLGLCLAAGVCAGVAVWSSRVSTDTDALSAPGQSSTAPTSESSVPTRRPTRLTAPPTSPPTTSGPVQTSSPTSGPVQTSSPTSGQSALPFNDSILRIAVDSYCSRDPSFEVMYGASSAYGDISTWDVSQVSNMSSLFAGKADCNPPIAAWNTSRVLSFSAMFKDAVKFNQPISGWQTSASTTMSSMFENAIAFNQPLADWDVSRVVSFDYMFYEAIQFNHRLCWSKRPRLASTRDVFMFSKCASPGGVTRGEKNVCWGYC